MTTERTPMYCVKCGQATYDAKYCDDCRCVFCHDLDRNCSCSRCETKLNDTDDDTDDDMSTQFCNYKQLPGKRVCHVHFCPVCLSETRNDNPLPSFGRYCSGCYKFKFVGDDTECISCGKLSRFLSSNFNCGDCECLYCDNINCIVHKCLLCNRLIWFNDPDLKYCHFHACKQCMYKPVANGRFCSECSVNRIVGTHTKRAN
jgi:hypothetical protein